MDSTQKKIFYYLGGTLAASIVVGSLYLMWNRINKITLSDWLEEYFKEIEEMIKKDKGKELSTETIGHIYHLISELEDYLYLVENYEFEEERMSDYYNKEKYKMQLEEMIQLRLKINKKAVRMAEKRLKFNLNNLDEIVKNQDLRNVKEILLNSKKPYIKLPEISSDNVRKAFILYSKKLKENKILEDEQTYLNDITGNSDFASVLTSNIYVNNLKLRDEIKAKYNINYKHLDALIHKHNLLRDNEVRYFYEEKNKMEILSNLFVG
jgi:hypothetical protein